jgi:hypothetical protein
MGGEIGLSRSFNGSSTGDSKTVLTSSKLLQRESLKAWEVLARTSRLHRAHGVVFSGHPDVCGANRLPLRRAPDALAPSPSEWVGHPVKCVMNA